MQYVIAIILFLFSFFVYAQESYLNTWAFWNSDTIQTGYRSPDEKSFILFQYIYDPEQPSFAFTEVFLGNQQIGDCSSHGIASPKPIIIKINGKSFDFLGVCTPPTQKDNITQWFYTTIQQSTNKAIFNELLKNKKIDIATPYFIASMTTNNFKKTHSELMLKHKSDSNITNTPSTHDENLILLTCRVNLDNNISDINYSIHLDSGTINGYKAEITDDTFRFRDDKFTHVINRFTGGMNLISIANKYMFSGSCEKMAKPKF